MKGRFDCEFPKLGGAPKNIPIYYDPCYASQPTTTTLSPTVGTVCLPPNLLSAETSFAKQLPALKSHCRNSFKQQSLHTCVCIYIYTHINLHVDLYMLISTKRLPSVGNSLLWAARAVFYMWRYACSDWLRQAYDRSTAGVLFDLLSCARTLDGSLQCLILLAA